MHDHAAQMANWLLENNIKPGDLVAVYLHNCAEYLMLLFAAHSIGASIATINYNLERKALMHSLSLAESKLLIVDSDAECQRRVRESKEEIEKGGTKIAILDFELKRDLMSRAVTAPDESLRRGMTPEFPFILVRILVAHRWHNVLLTLP